jgi:protein-tyrosine phosphatase
VIDLHCHVLPGIDDGPETIEGSVALARAAEAADVSTVVATSHVSQRYRNTPETIARLVTSLNTRLQAERVDLQVLPGAEIALTYLLDIPPERLAGLALNGGPWLLVEPPFTTTATGLEEILRDLQSRGHRIVLAHPERCPAFQRDPGLLESLVRAGMLTSVTAGALVGEFGGEARRFALELAQAEMIHNVASDAHDLDRRRFGTTKALEQAGLMRLADWLTHEVPAAIVGGEEEIPPRPPAGPSTLKPRRGSERILGSAWIRRRLKRAL